MAATGFSDKLLDSQQRRSSVLCVGLDPDPDRLPRHLVGSGDPAEAVLEFNKQVIEQTRGAACAYKLNMAFYEALGADGWHVLERTLAFIPPDIVTIADGKRGDIGNSARFYARATFEQLRFDACTISGYMGRDSIEAFLRYPGRAAYLLIRTSNQGASDLQELTLRTEPVYLHLARTAEQWASEAAGTLGFVVGATDAESLRSVRRACPTVPLLIPGIGAQGGSIRDVMQALSYGTGSVLINSSRSIIYASDGGDFAAAAGAAAEELRQRLAEARAD